MSRITSLLMFAAVSVVLISCSAPKEEIQEVKPEVSVAPPSEPDIDTRVYKFDERYFVKNASIDKETNVEDPLQAIRVIQLKEGSNQTLVISSFETVTELGQEVHFETWFAVEMPSFSRGNYNLSKASNIRFFRFRLGEKSLRFDGSSYNGSLVIDGDKDGYLTGSVEVEVSGETKSFDQPTRQFKTIFAGSFKIKEVPLEATRMKGR